MKDFSNAPEGATHWAPKKGDWREWYFKLEDEVWYGYYYGRWEEIKDEEEDDVYSTFIRERLGDLIEIPKKKEIVDIIVGRRMIYCGEIVTVIAHNTTGHNPSQPWVRHELNVGQKYPLEHFVDPRNLKPLPNGQW